MFMLLLAVFEGDAAYCQLHSVYIQQKENTFSKKKRDELTEYSLGLVLFY